MILAGGLGTRLAEETDIKPKPMVEVGNRPLLWHIMKHYDRYGVDEFFIALGYRGDVIKRFFLDYSLMSTDLTVSLGDGTVTAGGIDHERWKVHLVETGTATNTGGRIGRLAHLLGDEPFFLTYGDGISDVDLDALSSYHRQHGALVTLTAVRPSSRFGALAFEPDQPAQFLEKPQTGEGWINGGFMVVDRAAVDRIRGDGDSWEADVLESLSVEGKLMARPHEGFWQSVDTLRDLRYLQSLWDKGDPPWVTW